MVKHDVCDAKRMCWMYLCASTDTDSVQDSVLDLSKHCCSACWLCLSDDLPLHVMTASLHIVWVCATRGGVGARPKECHNQPL